MNKAERRSLAPTMTANGSVNECNSPGQVERPPNNLTGSYRAKKTKPGSPLRLPHTDLLALPKANAQKFEWEKIIAAQLSPHSTQVQDKTARCLELFRLSDKYSLPPTGLADAFAACAADLSGRLKEAFPDCRIDIETYNGGLDFNFFINQHGIYAELKIAQEMDDLGQAHWLPMLHFNGVQRATDFANINYSRKNLFGKEAANYPLCGRLAHQIAQWVDEKLPEVEAADPAAKGVSVKRDLVICGTSAGGAAARYAAAHCTVETRRPVFHFTVNGLKLGKTARAFYETAFAVPGFEQSIDLYNEGDGVALLNKHFGKPDPVRITVKLPRGDHAGDDIRVSTEAYKSLQKQVRKRHEEGILNDFTRFSLHMKPTTQDNLLADLGLPANYLQAFQGYIKRCIAEERFVSPEEGSPKPDFPSLNAVTEKFVEAWQQAKERNPAFVDKYGFGRSVDSLVTHLHARKLRAGRRVEKNAIPRTQSRHTTDKPYKPVSRMSSQHTTTTREIKVPRRNIELTDLNESDED